MVHESRTLFKDNRYLRRETIGKHANVSNQASSKQAP